MVLLIGILGVIALTIGIIICKESKTELWQRIGDILGAIGLALLIITFIAGISLGGPVSYDLTLDERIAMYEAENERIENDIAVIVQNYQTYESDIFKSLKVDSDSALALVSLFPELKSDSLVQAQIDIYVANNETIKQLKEQQISARVRLWWLCFG